MLTTAITAAVGGLLALFGIKPGRYLVGVAIGVKILIVGVGVVFGGKWLENRRRRAEGPPRSENP